MHGGQRSPRYLQGKAPLAPLLTPSVPPGASPFYGSGQAGPEDEQVPGECVGPTRHHQWGGAAGQDEESGEGWCLRGRRREPGERSRLGGRVAGTLVGAGSLTKATYPSQVLEAKLRDGNLDSTELAIAAAAQVSPQCLPLSALSSRPPVSCSPGFWPSSHIGTCHPTFPSGCRERTFLMGSLSVGQMPCDSPCALTGPWVRLGKGGAGAVAPTP